MMLHRIYATERFEDADGYEYLNRFCVGTTAKHIGETDGAMIARLTHGNVPSGCRFVDMWGRGDWAIKYSVERIETMQIGIMEVSE